MLFVDHTDARTAHGLLDQGLWFLFVAVAASGAVGILFYRYLPARLHQRPHICLWHLSRFDIEMGEARRHNQRPHICLWHLSRFDIEMGEARRHNNEMIFMERIPRLRTRFARYV
ncbi:MAG: hypothetical protein FD153_481 [Rhodospirillaceae bacterium]|nr:MAG: hypothetical protein FD153_481 [Rhodospirillaceae bacterium]